MIRQNIEDKKTGKAAILRSICKKYGRIQMIKQTFKKTTGPKDAETSTESGGTLMEKGDFFFFFFSE